MKLLTRLLLGVLLVIVLMIAAGGLVLGLFIDPNDYRSEIEQAALDKGGVELKINGEIGWSVFPWLGLALNDVAVRFPEQPQLASLKQAQLSVKLMPLLSGQMEMSQVLIDGLRLNLITTGTANNWTVPARSSAGQAETVPRSAESSDRPHELALDIAAINLTDAQINYVDERAGTRFELSGLDLATGQISNNQPVPLELKGLLRQYHNGEQTLSADSRVTTTLSADLAARRYTLSALEGKVDLTSAALGNKPLSLSLNANLEADLANQQVKLEQLSLALANVTLSGQLSMQNFATPALTGQISAADFDLKQLLNSLGQTVPATTDDQALRKLGFSASLKGDSNTLALEHLTLRLDGTKLEGRLAFDLKTQAPNLVLKGNALNADRYLPPKQQTANTADATQAGGSKPSAKERWSKENVIPLEPLQALSAEATLDLEQLTLSGISANQVGLTVSARNGQLNVSRLNANLYGGALRNTLALDARKAPLKISGTSNIKGIQIGELLTALNGKTPMTGALDSQAMLNAQGQSVHAIVNSLGGMVDISARDGVIEGINMAQTICQGINTVSSLGINTQQVDQSTPFANMGGKFQIVSGVVNNNDLSASLDAAQLAGRGTVDLPQALIDYRLGLTIKENLFKQTCSINNRLEGVELPLNCKGSFDTPPAKMCRPDASVFEELLKAEAKRKVEEKVGDKIEQKLEEKLGGEGAKSLIKGLFGN